MGLFWVNVGEKDSFDMPTAKVGRARNTPLESGVYKYSRSQMYHKKAIYKFTKKTTPKAAAEKKPAFVEKKVGGAKNGGTRKVATNKPKFDYPTYSKDVVKTSKNLFSKQKHSLRPSLSAGVIAIVLAGVHKGKKVIVLKQLGTGLLLVSGPYALNGCPLRRVNQRYLLAPKTKVDVSGVKVPEHVNDAYFKRAAAAKKAAAAAGKKDGDIFESKKEEYKPSEQRKTDQVAVDKLLLEAVKKHADGKLLKQYLRTGFGLSKGDYPHKMVF